MNGTTHIENPTQPDLRVAEVSTCPSIQFLNVDCMEFMRSKPDKYSKIGVVDPVYGIDGNSHRNNKSRGKCTKSRSYNNALWYQEKTNDEYFFELKRVTENQIIFGANYFPSISGSEFKTPRRNEYDIFIKEHPTNWIIWDKVNSTTSFNDCELIWVSFPVPTEIFYFMWSGMMQGISFKNGQLMNPFKSKNQKRIHPTEKPFEVYKYLLNRFANEGQSILDTHGGSMSISIVCDMLNLPLDICEIDSDYFQDGTMRFKKHKSQLLMAI